MVSSDTTFHDDNKVLIAWRMITFGRALLLKSSKILIRAARVFFSDVFFENVFEHPIFLLASVSARNLLNILKALP